MACDPQDLSRLIEQAQHRDPNAAEQLVEILYPAIITVIHRRLPPGTDPRDLAQDVLLRILNGLPGFRGGVSSLLPWARRIAFRTCLNAWRHKRNRPESTWSDLSEDQTTQLESFHCADSPSDPVESIATRDLLNRLLDELPPADRWLIQLTELEQRPIADVCTLTGWSPLNIRVRRFRARRRLRTAFKKLLAKTGRTPGP
jgi:RNA polymerase sigma factor (sigma-70 family)